MTGPDIRIEYDAPFRDETKTATPVDAAFDEETGYWIFPRKGDGRRSGVHDTGLPDGHTEVVAIPEDKLFKVTVADSGEDATPELPIGDRVYGVDRDDEGNLTGLSVETE